MLWLTLFYRTKAQRIVRPNLEEFCAHKAALNLGILNFQSEACLHSKLKVDCNTSAYAVLVCMHDDNNEDVATES